MAKKKSVKCDGFDIEDNSKECSNDAEFILELARVDSPHAIWETKHLCAECFNNYRFIDIFASAESYRPE